MNLRIWWFFLIIAAACTFLSPSFGGGGAAEGSGRSLVLELPEQKALVVFTDKNPDADPGRMPAKSLSIAGCGRFFLEKMVDCSGGGESFMSLPWDHQDFGPEQWRRLETLFAQAMALHCGLPAGASPLQGGAWLYVMTPDGSTAVAMPIGKPESGGNFGDVKKALEVPIPPK